MTSRTDERIRESYSEPAPGLREALSQKLREVFKVNPPGEFVGERELVDAIMDVIVRAALTASVPKDEVDTSRVEDCRENG